MDLTSLSTDIFLLITAYLSSEDCICCLRVSKTWNAAFSDPEVCRQVLLRHYPRAWDVRLASYTSDWSAILSEVAKRYHFLKTGTPRSVQKLSIAKSLAIPTWCRYYGVASWQRNLEFEGKTARFHYPETLWTYDAKLGILVFPSLELRSYAVYDLARGVLGPVDIESASKVVRRIRINDGLLVVEWCEPEAYHQLNESEMVSRHFATAFDITFTSSSDAEAEGSWQAIFRNEWRIHFLGLTLNSQDRFFSAHTRTHYVVYFWQPNRSAWGEDEPIESLTIWSIASPSPYRPSLDPSGSSGPPPSSGPHVIRRFSFSDLDFYNIRQRSAPTLRNLELDDNHLYVVSEDHRWLVGDQAGHNLPRMGHTVKTVGIPFATGPHWQDRCGADPSNGNVALSFCSRESDYRHPSRAPCWRHEQFPYLSISEAVDAAAGVRWCARHCFMLETIKADIRPKMEVSGFGEGVEAVLRDQWYDQLMEKGKIEGNERWLVGENGEDEVVILRFDAGAQCQEREIVRALEHLRM